MPETILFWPRASIDSAFRMTNSSIRSAIINLNTKICWYSTFLMNFFWVLLAMTAQRLKMVLPRHCIHIPSWRSRCFLMKLLWNWLLPRKRTHYKFLSTNDLKVITAKTLFEDETMQCLPLLGSLGSSDIFKSENVACHQKATLRLADGVTFACAAPWGRE